jgi:hypothetical protein
MAEYCGHTCHPSYSRKHKKEDHGPGRPGNKARPYLKNNQSKNGWQVAQVQHLPSKRKALTLMPCTAKN